MTERDVAALLGRVAPALADLPVTALGAGSDHEAFDIDGRFVARFPRGDDDAGALAREARLLAWLGPRLPLPIPAPRVATPPGARPFVTYPRLPGTPALGAPVDPAALAGPVGGFLRALNALDPREAAAHGLAEEDPAYEEWAAQGLHDLHAAATRGDVGPDARRHFAHTLGVPPPGVAPLRVIHGDFAAEHLLLDGGVPAGVIDWSDAALGDPARDLSGAIHWGGAPLLAAVLATYGPVDADTIERARWYALCRALADLTFGEGHGLPAYVDAGRRALAWIADEAGFAGCVARRPR